MQTNYNEVAVLQQGAGKVTGARKFVKKVNIHMRDRDVSENEETKKENGSSKDNLYLFCMAPA